MLGLLFYNLYRCSRRNLTQFNGKADLEFGRGKTQNNEGCRRHTFLCISPARRKYEGPGGFGEEARPPSVQEFFSSLSFPPRKSQQRSVRGTHAFPLLAAVPRQSRTLCNISRQALYHGIGLGFTTAPTITVPRCLAQNQYTGPIIKIKEYCNGVAHPVTKETITHYRKLIKDPCSILSTHIS